MKRINNLISTGRVSAGIRGCALAGKNVALLFEKASTRIRCAFTVACIDEGGHPEFLGKNDIHLGGKEDVKDTARVGSTRGGPTSRGRPGSSRT